MRNQKIMAALARARVDIDTAAMEVMKYEFGVEKDRIEEEIREARARVEAIEARVAVLEARK